MADEASSQSPAPEAPGAPQGQVTGAREVMASALVERGAWTQEQADEALGASREHSAEADTLSASAEAMQTARSVEQGLGNAGLDEKTSRFVGEMFRNAQMTPQSEEARNSTRAETEQHLKQQWGDKYDAMVDAARKEMHAIAKDFPEFPELLERTGLGNHPWIISSLAGRGVERAKRQFLGLE